ncbi:MAG: 50S ribosomal protein L6 [Ignavibacteriales bacterium]|nr:50S ribosomal protein L6 [Ignavibacteriales bacterium]
MSRIGRKPIPLPAGVEVKKEGESISVKGPKGMLSAKVHSSVKIEITKEEVLCSVSSEGKMVKALHGLWRAILSNMVVGVTKGHDKKLEITGVGYKAELIGKRLKLSLGYSHPILVMAPQGITVTAPTPTSILVSGADKALVGQLASKLRSFRPPEPYKGKGIRYEGEHIRRKAGKAAATAGK